MVSDVPPSVSWCRRCLVSVIGRAPQPTLWVLGACALLGACRYDFDEPFSAEPWGPNADAGTESDASEAGVGGTGGSAGSGGAGASGEAGAAGQAGSGGGPAGAAGSTAEDCSDSIDNDGDGRTDCADTDCTAQGYVCTPDIPSGWLGWFRLRTQANAQPPPAAADCPDGSPPERYFTTTAAAADCEPCSCGPLTGAQCDAPGIACDFFGSNCVDAQPRPELGDFACHDLNVQQLSCYLTGDNPLSNDGSCEPVVDVPGFTNPLPFAETADLCPAPGPTNEAGCAEGFCYPPGDGAYVGPVCVMTADDEAPCPPGWDENPAIRLYRMEDTIDNRGCSPCACSPDPVSVNCVGGAYRVWDLDNCIECGSPLCSPETEVSTSVCEDLTEFTDGGSISIRLLTLPTAQGGECAPVGGVPLGSVTTSKGATACCL